ncbi:sulfite exporter TauE/SafE family protein [Tropicimonas aquimaris]|uniref:Probable membrane transporter protein n=1 Tax=Tropicimonas aquimaris TaxID=914152 RepID=A0ABW3IR93_9RHOB
MLSTTTLLVICAVFFSAFLRGMAGFGFALAAVPIVSLVLSPVEAVAIGVLLQVVVGLRDVFVLHADIHRPSLVRLSLGSLLGTPVGILALTALSPDAARILIATAILVGLVMILRYKPTEQRAHNGLALAAGVASGAFSGLAAIPGPPAVAYYLGSGINSVQTRASLLFFFFIAALMATPGLFVAGAVNSHTLWLSFVSIPALALGTWLGTEAFNRLDSTQYRQLAIAVMGLSALLAGWRGLSAYI